MMHSWTTPCEWHQNRISGGWQRDDSTSGSLTMNRAGMIIFTLCAKVTYLLLWHCKLMQHWIYPKGLPKRPMNGKQECFSRTSYRLATMSDSALSLTKRGLMNFCQNAHGTMQLILYLYQGWMRWWPWSPRGDFDRLIVMEQPFNNYFSFCPCLALWTIL